METNSADTCYMTNLEWCRKNKLKFDQINQFFTAAVNKKTTDSVYICDWLLEKYYDVKPQFNVGDMFITNGDNAVVVITSIDMDKMKYGLTYVCDLVLNGQPKTYYWLPFSAFHDSVLKGVSIGKFNDIRGIIKGYEDKPKVKGMTLKEAVFTYMKDYLKIHPGHIMDLSKYSVDAIMYCEDTIQAQPCASHVFRFLYKTIWDNQIFGKSDICLGCNKDGFNADLYNDIVKLSALSRSEIYQVLHLIHRDGKYFTNGSHIRNDINSIRSRK